MNTDKEFIRNLARRYETADFLPADPSVFMHKVQGQGNQETMAFIASCLSYGSRKQFFPKIQYILDVSHGEVDNWLRSGQWQHDIPDTTECYYRLHTYHDIHNMLAALSTMLHQYGSMKNFVAQHTSTGFEAIEAICSFFFEHGDGVLVPKNTQSACKRVCMFLRWMVRSDSAVDLGLWADIIDRRTLIMPLDTHVVQEAMNMGLLHSRTASMSTAKKLTKAMLDIFPYDPLKGDFALFGLGIDKNGDKG